MILPGGATCKFPILGCEDSFTAFYWSPKDAGYDNCIAARFKYLVHGNIKVDNMTSGHSDQPVQYAVAELGKYVFALKLLTRANICHLNGYMTELSNLFFVETPGHFNPFHKAQSTDVDMSVYVNSKMRFYEIANNERLVNFATELVLRRCAAERQTLIHKLQLAKTTQKAFQLCSKTDR